MKKRLLLLLTCVLTLFGVSYAGSITVTKANIAAVNNTNKYLTSATDIAVGGYTYNFLQFNPYNGQIKINGTGTNGFNLYNKTAIPKIKSVVLTATTDFSTSGVWYMKVSNSAAVSGQAGTSDIKGTINKTTLTFEVPAGTEASYFHINLTTSPGGSGYLSSFTINYEDGQSTNKTNVTLSFANASKSISVGETFTNTLTANPTGALSAVKFSSSDATVASVNANGQVTALKSGNATINAEISNNSTYNDAKASYNVTVTGGSTGGEAKTATLNTTNFKGGGTSYAKYTYSLDGITYTSVFYLTSGTMQFNTGNDNGKASAIVVTATNPDYIIESIDVTFGTVGNGIKIYSRDKAFGDLTVGTAPTIPTDATSIESPLKENKNNIIINAPAFAIYPAGSGVIQVSSVTVHYKKAKEVPELKFSSSTGTAYLINPIYNLPSLTKNTDGEIFYKSSDTTVATVNESTGEITPKKAGTSIITATSTETDTYASGTASYTLTVEDDRSDANLTWSVKDFTVTIGQENISWPKPSFKTAVHFTSSNKSVAEIELVSGEITLKKGGVTVISASFDGDGTRKPATATYTLTVYENYNPSFKDETFVYGATNSRIFLNSNYPSNIRFSYDPEGIVTINPQGTYGNVTINKAGSTTVTASWDAIDYWTEGSSTFTIIIEKATFDNTNFSDSYELNIGESLELLKDLSSKPEITYSITDGDIVSIVDNKLVALKAGETTVTASWGDDNWNSGSAEFTVNVNKNTYQYNFEKDITILLGNTVELYDGEDHPEFKVDITSGHDVVSLEGATIQAKKVGSAILTVSWGDENYNEGSAKINITVTNIYTGNIAFVVGKASYNGTARVIPFTTVPQTEDDICQINVTSGGVYESDGHLRWYSGSYLQITPAEGVIVTKIAWTDSYNANNGNTFSVKNNNGTVTSTGTGKNNTGYWTGSSSDIIEIQAPGQIRTGYVEVEYQINITPAPECPVVKIGDVELENGGDLTIVAGTVVTITSEGATSISGNYEGEDDIEEPLNFTGNQPYTYTVAKSGVLTLTATNAGGDSEEFMFMFLVSEIDPNMPGVGSTFRQVLDVNKDTELVDGGYYVIGYKDDSVLAAMSVSEDSSNPSTQNVTFDSFEQKYYDAGNKNTANRNIDILTTTGNDILILKLEKNDQGLWGLKTVNLDNGIESSQKYLSNEYGANNVETTNLAFRNEFVPVSIDFSNRGNANIRFEEEGRTISFSKSNNRFNLGNYYAVQLYKFTTAKMFEPNYEDVKIKAGETYTINVEGEHPEISYRVKGNTRCISIEEGNVIKAQDMYIADVATVMAEWPHTEEWYGNLVEFNVTFRYPAELGFRYGTIRGKKDVGVAAQAAYYTGDGTLTYAIYEYENPEDPENSKLKPTDDININTETGMIRPEDFNNWIISKVYTVVAHVEGEDGSYVEGDASYTFVIEAPEEGELGDGIDVTFDFEDSNNKYGFFDGFDSNSTSNNNKYGAYYEHNINQTEGNESHIPVVFVEEGNINLNLANSYRWFSTTKGWGLRFYTNATLEFTADKGKITSIEFVTNVQNQFLNSNITIENGDRLSDGKWTSTEGVDKVKFTITADKIDIFTIKVGYSLPTSDKPLANLYFDTSKEGVEKYFNMFEDEVVTLPELKHANGMNLSDVAFTIDQVEDETVGFSINDKDEDFDWDNIKVSVTDPGVYTLRAEYNGEDFLNGFAILRLNVFPRMNVLPNKDHDSTLADDERTNNPNLTLVTPVLAEDGSQTARIDLPSLDQFDDPLKYSTVTLSYVTVKHGEQEITYRALNEGEEESEVLKDINNIDHFDFTKDGSVTYHMLYANTEDFFMDATVHVVLMPQVFEVEETGDAYNLNGSKNSKIQYRFVGGTPKNVRRASEPDDDGWITAEGNTISVPTSEIPNGATALEYRSMKDIQGIVDRIEDVDDGKLYSEVKSIALAAQTVTVTVGSISNMAFQTTSSTYKFEDIIVFSDAVNYGTDFTVSLVAKDNAQGWAATDATGADLPEAYNEVLGAVETGLATQYADIFGVATDAVVDGFFTGVKNVNATSTDGGKTFTVTAELPCSGVYELSIVKAGDATVEFEAPEEAVTFEVYPNLQGLFGSADEAGFNIDGYALMESDNMVTENVNFTKDVVFTSNMICYIPGTYFASAFTVTPEKTGASNGQSSLGGSDKKAANSTGNAEHYFAPVDLTALNNEQVDKLGITVYVAKNGASKTYNFQAVKNQTIFNESTGVEGIGSEDGEAEYFDLNGFKVNADRLEKGIYIKVQNGTATKVLVK